MSDDLPDLGTVVLLRTDGRPARARVVGIDISSAARVTVRLFFDDPRFHDIRGTREVYLSAYLAALLQVVSS